MKSLFFLLLPHLIACSDNKENKCSICYDKINFEANDSLRTKCGHDFHTKCLARWTNTHNSCPLCRLKNPRRMTHIEKNAELRKSARFGNLPMLQEMIKQGADVNSRDDRKNTALMCAALEGNINVIEELLIHGAFLEARNFRNRTALTHAALAGKTDVVQFFLDRGADPCIDLQLYSVKPEIQKLIIQHAKNLKLRIISRLGNLEPRVSAFLEPRKDVNWTPLISAAVAVFALLSNIFLILFLLRNDYN